ncbi:MAG: PQQ-binding-like beta-propeller repeat protein [Bythopirellula sp.]|nr:PQQ-binding-like beta-propeller repeat protein [Bythopirellula sp.]
MLRNLIFCLIACHGFATCRAESIWPEFRGPGGQGISTEKNLPLTWSESENIRWKTPVPGFGWSSPVVAEGKIWLTTATVVEASEEERAAKVAGTMMADQMTAARTVTLWAVELDLASGSVLRKIKLLEVVEPAPIHSLNSYASPTPILEGTRLYCHFGDYGTVCLDTNTGKTLWEKRFALDHRVGPGSSPALWEDLLIVPCDGADVQYIVALNKDTGETVWQIDRPPIEETNGEFRKSYSTPLVIEVNGAEQVVIPGAQWCIAYEPRTGKEIWRVNHGRGFSIVPRPVFDGELLFFCTGYMSGKLLAVRPDGTGDVTDSHIAWEQDKQIPTMPSPVLIDNRIYLASDGGIAACYDAATGEEKWRGRLEGRFSSSPLYAEGRIYVASHAGVTTIFAASDEFKILAENQLDGQLMASPVPVDGTLLLRTGTHLYRVGE